ncbi:MAG: tetratricopeptide (TPR) repeat protein [Saprospiraceae bacterium]|jgi:tetratricopeptide (TPR) repeat protein
MKQLLAGSILLILVLVSCNDKPQAQQKIVANALNGTPLYVHPPSEELIAKYEERKQKYLANVHNMENLIWFGRFAAYKGDYEEAMKIYAAGIQKSPKDSRIYRHRGHRYITLRQFEKAITDLEKASTLIQGTMNAKEPDGMPNARNVPVSTNHGNIYYHLGLAYYLNGQLPKALNAYLKCLKTSTEPDNLVSATHWLYMILRKLGRLEEAEEILKPIAPNMNIIENMSYHQLCLFYKGVISESELLNSQRAAASNDAVRYGLANWYEYNGNEEQARKNMREIIKGKSWASFGYIAAEADLYRK